MADKVFPQIIKVQLWGPKGERKKLGTDPTTNPYLNAPLPMLALTAAVVECVLSGMIAGAVMDFSDSVYRSRWEYYLEALVIFQRRSPSYMQMVQKKVQDTTGVAVLSQRSVNDIYDFDALEVAARAEEEGI
ncbi:hypothetical protein SCLCIDRAFT_29262 [Scleroderma citrinum Foug A]|uniref:DUF6532 domain-containing protein n=1 Tax=Scleroderma citrinum Foug A TaxID=1036808 RepID=A0A0C3DL91_9AGAM|nr:hypothetical protein SCLCIDRAFT_29262 [Scleroderma citrinum Foug A]